MPLLTISEVARQVGMQPSAIRYYEQMGLLPPYDGSYGMVARLVTSWRKTESVRPRTPERIDPKQATRLVTCPAEQLTKGQQRPLDRLALSCPAILPLRQWVREFRAALQDDYSQRLRQWMERAQQCEFRSLVRFAYGLKKDLAAVLAAVHTGWSNGQVEGQINRLKTIKRQMYGQAGFVLLRVRVLPYGPAFSTPGSSP